MKTLLPGFRKHINSFKASEIKHFRKYHVHPFYKKEKNNVFPFKFLLGFWKYSIQPITVNISSTVFINNACFVSTHHFLLAVPLTIAVRPGGFNAVCPSVSSCFGMLHFWPKLSGTGFIFHPLLFSTHPVRSFEPCWTETAKLAVRLCVPLVGMWTYVHSA